MTSTTEARTPPIKGMWVVASDHELTPENVKAARAALEDASYRGKDVVVSEGITFRWRPVEVETLDVQRLARAMRAAFPNMKSYGGEDCDCPETEGTDSRSCFGHDRRDQEAAAIAAEYERLTPHQEPPE